MRKKPSPEDHMSAIVMIRMTESQKQTIFQAAKAAGLDTSAWVRFVCLREAEK